jgi:hypothetical protein
MPQELRDIMTADEVAEYLRQTKRWVYEHASKRRRPYLPRLKYGEDGVKRAPVRFRREDVLRFVEEWSGKSAA